MKDYGTQVWLHRTEEGELVGVSSLAERHWSWPPPTGPKKLLSIIPCVGLQKAFQGEPKDVAPEERFAVQILDHLIHEATTRIHREPLIGLMVDEENKRAIRYYEKAGFIRLPKPYHRAGLNYLRMALDISAFVPHGESGTSQQG
jgi:hypothetical protein